MHAQNHEDDLLLAHFGDYVGRALDIGAWSGACFSNTYALFERGWTGVCVEPSPTSFLKLMEAHKERPGVELVNVAIAPEAGLRSWYDCGGDALSTLNAHHVKAWQEGNNVKFRQFTVATATVGQLLERFGRDFDVLSVDVEGGSAELLTQFPLETMPRLKAIVVEHDKLADSLSAWARMLGFREAARNGENLVLLR